MATDPLAPILQALGRPGRPSSDFDLNPNVPAMAEARLRPAAVLVPFDLTGPEVRVILTKRSSALKHHPGQIAFPGGKVDETDADATAAALREAEEEIGLPQGLARPFGTLPAHRTVTGFTVTPILARITEGFAERPEPGEVDEVFRVPLAHVLDPNRFQVESRIWRGERRFYYTVPWGPYYIWGATARILRALADRVAP